MLGTFTVRREPVTRILVDTASGWVELDKLTIDTLRLLVERSVGLKDELDEARRTNQKLQEEIPHARIPARLIADEHEAGISSPHRPVMRLSSPGWEWGSFALGFLLGVVAVCCAAWLVR